MNLKRIKILDCFLIIALCFLFHFLYEWFPNRLYAIFFPVNESIWEHMKMIFSSICLYGIIDYIILTKNKIKFNNFWFQLFFTSFISIPIYLIIYLPVYNIIGENMIFNISLMCIVVIISEIISYHLLNSKHYKFLNYISPLLIIVSYIIFGYLTYHPIQNDLFLDKEKNMYGINNYNI